MRTYYNNKHALKIGILIMLFICWFGCASEQGNIILTDKIVCEKSSPKHHDSIEINTEILLSVLKNNTPHALLKVMPDVEYLLEIAQKSFYSSRPVYLPKILGKELGKYNLSYNKNKAKITADKIKKDFLENIQIVRRQLELSGVSLKEVQQFKAKFKHYLSNNEIDFKKGMNEGELYLYLRNKEGKEIIVAFSILSRNILDSEIHIRKNFLEKDKKVLSIHFKIWINGIENKHSIEEAKKSLSIFSKYHFHKKELTNYFIMWGVKPEEIGNDSKLWKIPIKNSKNYILFNFNDNEFVKKVILFRDII